MSLTRSDKPAHDSECFKPSSFASRKAERAARGELEPRPRRLVSLGVRERWLEGFGTKSRGSMVTIEYFFDRDHSNHYYTRALPNGTLERMDRGGTDATPPEPLGVIRGRGMSSGTFPTSLPDQPASLLT